ncbi:MAG: FAD-dependent oxidoreductase [Acidocella sp.]|nr:FAD-dependent oxidoreductase [Acidocella sp.]
MPRIEPSSPLPPSLYAETARQSEPLPSFTGEARASVAIIGGGFAGLSAALHLAELGVDVALLEANEIGWGASGRNGGQVNPGLKHSPAEILRDYGENLGARMIALSGMAPDLVFSIIEKHGIACAGRRGGTLRAVKTIKQADAAKHLTDDYASHGAPVKYFDAPEVAARTGTPYYLGAMFDPRGGDVNPLGYARGLAMAAQRAGAKLYTGSRVQALARAGNGWVVSLACGTLHAEHVVLCTNAYESGLWPGLARSMVPVFSMIAASEPLSMKLAATVMPARSVLYEQADITVYFRVDDGNRLLMGGRSPSRDTSNRRDFRYLLAYAQKLWPASQDVDWTHFWNGQLAMTADHYPHLHEPAEGVIACLGCNGRGVALMTAMGQQIAARILGARTEELAMPVSGIRTIPLHAFWPAGVAARVAYGRFKEAIGL